MIVARGEFVAYTHIRSSRLPSIRAVGSQLADATHLAHATPTSASRNPTLAHISEDGHHRMMNALRGDESLRRGRWSQCGHTYFVTICTENRNAGLPADSLGPKLRAEVLACEDDSHWRVSGAVIMPDHLHLLVELIGKLPLSRIIARVKTKTRDALQIHGLRWQGNYYEHRLRDTDSVEDVLMYLFLNPYRAGLVLPAEAYPWFWLHPSEAAWFRGILNDDQPYPDWLR